MRSHLLDALNSNTECKICEIDFKTQSELLNHKNRDHSDIIYECNECKK